jgi:hypothetical protein
MTQSLLGPLERDWLEFIDPQELTASGDNIAQQNCFTFSCTNEQAAGTSREQLTAFLESAFMRYRKRFGLRDPYLVCLYPRPLRHGGNRLRRDTALHRVCGLLRAACCQGAFQTEGPLSLRQPRRHAHLGSLGARASTRRVERQRSLRYVLPHSIRDTIRLLAEEPGSPDGRPWARGFAATVCSRVGCCIAATATARRA